MTPIGMITIFLLATIFGIGLLIIHAFLAGGIFLLSGLAMGCKICMEIKEANENFDKSK